MQRHRFDIQNQLARFDLGEIENIVYDFDQIIAALFDGLEIDDIFGVCGFSEQDVGIAHDAGERAADLVAHISEELVLALIELFQPLLRLVNLGNVGRAADESRHVAGIIDNRIAARLEPTPLAVMPS